LFFLPEQESLAGIFSFSANPLMKTFFGSLLGSFIGVLVAVFLAALLIVGLVSSLVSNLGKSKDKPDMVSENAFLHLRLNKKITERSSKNPFDNISFNSFSAETPPGLNDILAGIDKAKEDPKIKGIYLDLSSIPAGIATLEEIRSALLEFKKAGKVIFSYSGAYSQGAYYLASVSDKIFLNPAGVVEWKGLSAQIMFYKGLMDKLDVSAQIFRHGKFKSAIEPFDLDKMSPANREQTSVQSGIIFWKGFQSRDLFQ
jgi:protease-4